MALIDGQQVFDRIRAKMASGHTAWKLSPRSPTPKGRRVKTEAVLTCARCGNVQTIDLLGLGFSREEVAAASFPAETANMSVTPPGTAT